VKGTGRAVKYSMFQRIVSVQLKFVTVRACGHTPMKFWRVQQRYAGVPVTECSCVCVCACTYLQMCAAGMGHPDACQGQTLAALPPGQSPSRTKRASGLVLMPSMQTLQLQLLVRGLIWRMRAKALAHACLQVSMHQKRKEKKRLRRSASI